MERLFFKTTLEKRKFHERIANNLLFSEHSLRKFEEISYHLYKSHCYNKLKESLSNIENFLFLFNTNSKYELYFYWNQLNQKGFDPAIEYNNSIQIYFMSYYTNQDEMFKIVLQISRFLKEFSDFENNLTPDFRHPPIQGQEELKIIGLINELNFLKIGNKKNGGILTQMENLNIQTPFNREIVREYFLTEIKKEKESKPKYLRSEDNMY